MKFSISGQVKSGGNPVPDLVVMGFDKDLLSDDFLGKSITDNNGEFKIEYSEKDFGSLFEKRPDIYLQVKSSDGTKTIYETENSVRFKANNQERFDIDIPDEAFNRIDDKDDENLDKNRAVGVKFNEDMDGHWGVNINNFKDGEDYGIRHNSVISFSATIEIDSVDRFIGVSNHEAELSGFVVVKAIAGSTKMEIKNGIFNLMNISTKTGHRNMSYSFNFETPSGDVYFLSGDKDIFHDKGSFDIIDDMTTLFISIYNGKDNNEVLLGCGIMHFRMRDILSLVKTMKPFNHSNMLQGMAAVSKFATFFMGEAIKTYAPGPRFIINTRYKNFVISGGCKLQNSAEEMKFFLFSGILEKNFPWGDGGSVSDVAIIISSENGTTIKYGITARSLKSLYIDLEGESFIYKGEMFEITAGNTLSFFDIHSKKNNPDLKKVEVDIDFQLESLKYNDKIDLTFDLIENFEKRIPNEIEDVIDKLLPNIGMLGLFINPYKINITEGSIKISTNNEDKVFEINLDNTIGEAETAELEALREPTINFNYLCGINNSDNEIYLDINTGVLRNEREKYGKDLIDNTLGKIIKPKIHKNVVLKDTVEDNDTNFDYLEDVLTLINNQYPTALLERKIVKVSRDGGSPFYALTCSAHQINPFPINSDKETSVVALTYEDTSAFDGKPPDEDKVNKVYDRDEKFEVLDQVIEKTNFFDTLDKKFNESGKTKSEFSIIIKPNFMFMYSKDDRTTFTDPALVEHLVKRVRKNGFTNIKVGEARSTLSIFYDKRDVKSVADYIGFKENGNYEIIDMSDNLVTEDFGGKLGRHKVNKDWKNADFRISFAKNKTHTYAYYTLTMKNIYGALADEYKFKVFHHEMGDIYKPTIDFIKKYPIHFGFIDGIIAADGPFGIFASSYPQLTMTIIGGEDIVAVDWVGSGKMGINPMLSRYMQEAVEEFGKPKINIIGDGDLYKFWTNIPRIADIGAHTMDKHYLFGFAVYYLLSHMDPQFPPKPTEYKLMNTLKKYSGSLSEWVYKMPNQPPSFIHEILNKIIFKMWQ